MAFPSRNRGLLLALVCLAANALIVPRLFERPRPPASAEMQVALPRFVQVLMAGGDRYLAANLAGFRALVSEPHRMAPENFRVLALVQSDAAWLNPAHEDNYYIAAAILPWYGEAAAAQFILKRASAARPFDWLPPFYYAFNAIHFYKNPVEGAEWMREAARHTRDEDEQLGLQQVAALWVAKGEDPEFAIRLHRTMAKESKHKGFANFLDKRADRLENLLLIDRAVARYRTETGTLPARLGDLLAAGMLPRIPDDPFHGHYLIDRNGKAQAAAVAPVAARPEAESKGKQ